LIHPSPCSRPRKRLADATSVDLRRGELEKLPIDDASCDAALLLLALSYVDDPRRVVHEAARIVKPGDGRIVVVDLLPHDRDDFRRQMGQRALGFSPDVVTEMLTTCGLTDVRIRPLPTEASARGPALQIATAARRSA